MLCRLISMSKQMQGHSTLLLWAHMIITSTPAWVPTAMAVLAHSGGGAERWGEQKGQGRGRGALVDPGRRGPPRDGFTDRWVGAPGEEPSPGGRPPRMEKWGPEGECFYPRVLPSELV